MHAHFPLALAALLAAPALTVFAQTTDCDGRFIDGIGIPGVGPQAATINALTEWDPDGPGPAKPLLVVGASNSDIAGYTVSRGVYAFDGSSWRSLGQGLQAANAQRGVNAFAVYKGELYAAGDFTNEFGSTTQLFGLARWDGAAWQPVPGNPSSLGFQSLFVFNDELIVASLSQAMTIGGINVGGAARFDGQQWRAFGTTPAPTSIRAFGTFQGDLYAAGTFATVGATTFNNIARWDGANWQPLGAGTPGTNARIHALKEFQGWLYVGGEFTQAGSATIIGVARWNGSEWSATQIPANSSPVYTFLEHDSKLIVGGAFQGIGNSGAYQLAAWSGVSWSALSYDIFGVTNSTSIKALACFDGSLFAGGYFNGINASNFAGLVRVPGDPTKYLQSPTPIRGSAISGFATLHDELYSYGILSYDANNVGTPALAKRVNGDWQLHGGVLGGAYTPNDDTLIGRLRDTAHFNDELIFVGTFSSIDGIAAQCVAAFNGTNWHAVLPQGLLPGSTALHSSVVFENSLILAGRFDNASTVEGPASNIVRWDGSQLHSMGTLPGTIYAIRTYEGVLYAGTDTDAFRWDGTRWIAMRSPSNVGITNVNSFSFFQGRLIAGTRDRPFAWSGTDWIPLGIPAIYNDLIQYQDELFAVGNLTKSGFNAVRWKGTGQWLPLGSARDYTSPRSSVTTSLTCGIVFNGELHLGGLSGTLINNSYNFGFPRATILTRYTSDTLPRFEGQPTSQIFTLNQEARLQASLEAGAERPSLVSFQWKRNGDPITNGPSGASPGGGTVQGATSATLHIFGIQPSDAGSFELIATSSCGTQTSSPASLLVRLIPQDINADGFVNDEDFALFVLQYDALLCSDSTMPDNCSADFNSDGVVDDADFSLFLPAYETLFADGR